MAVFYLRNSRIPDGKIVPVTVALSLDTLQSTASIPASGVAEFPNLVDPEGDGTWILMLETAELDSSGNPIPPEVVNVVTTGTVHLEIEAALGRMGQKIDWGTPLPDTRAPELVEITPPLSETENVNIMTDVIVRLKDALPAAGIDLSSVNMSINSVPVISSGVSLDGGTELVGNVFDLTIIYKPTRVFS